jgi:nucleoside-diphosphate-sugar epimerase
MKCFVTGASGYVGSRVCRRLQEDGHKVVLLQRSLNATDTKASVIPFQLGSKIDPGFFQGADALIHCAWDMRATGWDQIHKTNVSGSIRLFQAAANEGVRKLIFISSISAFESCQSMYGQAKLEVEKAVFKLGGVVVRPGLVYGDCPGGIAGVLSRVVARFPVIPIVGRRKLMYLCHEEDLIRLIATLIDLKERRWLRPITCANPEPITFGEIVQRFARAKGREVTLVPVSWKLVWGILRSLEALGLPTGFKSDSLVGLMNPNPNADFQMQQELSLEFRPLP